MVRTSRPMLVLCAWCEVEGQPAILREDDSRDPGLVTHGICLDHRVKLLTDARESFARITPSARGPST